MSPRSRHMTRASVVGPAGSDVLYSAGFGVIREVASGGVSAGLHLSDANRRLRGGVAGCGFRPAPGPPLLLQARELRVWGGAHRRGVGAVSGGLLPGGPHLRGLRRARHLPLPVGAGAPELRAL